MLIDLRPLLTYRDYRLLRIGQTVSSLGTMVSYVAVPWQVYELTHSTLLVGLLGTVQLAPVLLFALLGGSVADSMDRRKLLVVSECLLALGALTLATNGIRGAPNVALIFVVTALMQAVSGFHRPAMDAMVQKLVAPKDFAAVYALGAFCDNLASIAGPALGGVVIAVAGVRAAYLVDVLSFGGAVVTLALMRAAPAPAKPTKSHAANVVEGLRYAFRRPELLGTYLIDIVAMAFAFPTALFPAMGAALGGARQAGFLFSAMAVGSATATILSGWTPRVRRHGAMVVAAATIWGLAIAGAGGSSRLPTVLVCLAVAGAADMISGIFRSLIWNDAIPNEMRGRLAGIERVSYMTGPLLGNTRAGWVAGVTSIRFSIVSGGILCAIGVPLCALLLPRLWTYRAKDQG